MQESPRKIPRSKSGEELEGTRVTGGGGPTTPVDIGCVDRPSGNRDGEPRLIRDETLLDETGTFGCNGG